MYEYPLFKRNRKKIYITCFPLLDRPFYEKALEWKEKLRDQKEIPLEEFIKAFPHLGRLYLEGLFERKTIQEYFEGIDLDSHNMRMYLFAKKFARHKGRELKHILYPTLEHLEVCAVKPVDLKKQQVWGYFGSYKTDLDFDYFDISSKGYGFVHGRSEKGLVVIREVKEEEFQILKEWFEKRAISKENPFKYLREF